MHIVDSWIPPLPFYMYVLFFKYDNKIMEEKKNIYVETQSTMAFGKCFYKLFMDSNQTALSCI